jgi:S1-C subfamily serine protease
MELISGRLGRSGLVISAAIAGAIFLQPTAAAERARSAADATVFIRLVGSVRAAVEGTLESARLDQVEIGSGSGFVISQDGYVLTNHHVVTSDDLTFTVDGKRIKLAFKISTIDVCFPPDASASRALPSPCVPASLAAADPALDLAVLYISTPGLPYVAFGDSDAVNVGRQVSALGYPFGRQLKIGQAMASDIVPEVSTSAGTISAVRGGDDGDRQFLQISSNLNPGNSGGPVVDPDGYAVGVIRMKLTGGDGIGFAVPINQVKSFLEANGLDRALPTRRLILGPMQHLEGKGIRLPLPDGFSDVSPFRSRVETDAKAGDIALRIDRVFSPLGLLQLDQALATTSAFEPLRFASSERDFAAEPEGNRLVLGRAAGTTTDGKHDVRMSSAVFDLGGEKLVARYVGSADAMAFNESIVRASLAGLAGDRLRTGELASADAFSWSERSESPVPLPAGWIVEPGSPTRCSGLPAPSTAISAYPAADFTIALRVAAWPAADVSLDKAATACGRRRGTLAGASYVSSADWLGVSYSVEGVFIQVGAMALQLEVLSPAQQAAVARGVLAAAATKAAE